MVRRWHLHQGHRWGAGIHDALRWCGAAVAPRGVMPHPCPRAVLLCAAAPATSLDIARVLDTPLAVLILNEYLTTVGAKSSLDFWKAGRKFMLTYRGRPQAMLKKAKKVYDEHLAGKEVLYLKASTVYVSEKKRGVACTSADRARAAVLPPPPAVVCSEAIKEIVEGDGSDVSNHMFRQAMKCVRRTAPQRCVRRGHR